MNAVEELRTFEQTLGSHIKTLQDFAKVQAEHEGLHFLLGLQKAADGGSQVIVQVINVNGGNASVAMDGVPGAFFYEAYRASLPQIFERAIERAKESVGAKAREIRQRIEDDRKALDEAESALSAFLGTPPTAPSKSAPRGKHR